MLIHSLYLCYFGLREPLVQTQVLPYLRELLKDNIKIGLLTFEPNFKEKWSQNEIAKQKQELAQENIAWYCLPYHKTPSVPATFYDVLAGARFARRMIRKQGVNVLHARVHVPAMMGTIAKNLSGGKVKLLFDIRGFMPEEYTDAGVWRADGQLYRNVKKIEKWLLAKSDAFVVLTEKARQILFPESAENGFDGAGRPVAVIPCCVDLKRFEAANEQSRREIRCKLNLAEQRPVIVYVGALGGWYLTEEMVEFLATAREMAQSTFALILTQSEPEQIITALRTKGFGDDDFLVTGVSPEEIPRYLSAADAALSFIKPCFSKLSSSPTKIAEYLAAGVPVITNGGVGDVAEMVETGKVGAVVADFSRDSYLQALREIKDLQQNPNLAERCRESAKQRFDLVSVGGAKYRSLYDKLL